MSDKPTKKPSSGKAKLTMPGPVKDPTEIKQTSPGIVVMAFPPEPKVSSKNDNARQEAKFGSRGAVKPWKPKGGRAASRSVHDVKPRPISKKVGDASMGISPKTGYKVVG